MQAEQGSVDGGVTAVNRRLVIGLLLLAGAAVALAVGLTSHHGRLPGAIATYAVSADGTNLSVVVQHGSCDDDVRVAVTETPERVTLFASVRNLGAQACDSALRSTTVNVSLHEAVGVRVVVDGAHGDRPVSPAAGPSSAR